MITIHHCKNLFVSEVNLAKDIRISSIIFWFQVLVKEVPVAVDFGCRGKVPEVGRLKSHRSIIVPKFFDEFLKQDCLLIADSIIVSNNINWFHTAR